jgi:hypothetical protein
MAVYYMDSSSIVKRYANEVGSAWVMGITDSATGNEIYVVRLTGVEVVSAAETHGLRGYDAVQLAAACQINALLIMSGLPPLTFVASDHALNAAATAEGLTVDDPNTHP